MTKRRRHSKAKAEFERRKRLLVAGVTVVALSVVTLLIFLGVQARKSGGETKIEPVATGTEIVGDGRETETDPVGPETGITEDGFPYQGSPDAPVKFIEYSDYLCGHCGNFALEKEPRIVKEYVTTGKVQYIYHYYALGEAQVLLGEAAHCAADQGHFWKYHKVMFENQGRFGSISTWEELQALLVEFAGQVGLDVPDFETCWTSHRHQQTIINSIMSAREVGVGGTPTFSIQGELIVGNVPYDTFQQAIEAALAELEQ
jgi:protein-disulfide isomerase